MLASEALEVDPKRPPAFDDMLALEALEVDPKRLPAFAGLTVEATFDGKALDSLFDPNRLEDEDFAGTLASEAPKVDVKRENELGGGVERAPSKPNGDVDAVVVLGGVALASVPEVEKDGSGVDPADPLPVDIFVRAAGSGLGKNEPGLVVDELEASLWPKIPSALVDFAVRGGRGDASGETLPKVGFDP